MEKAHRMTPSPLTEKLVEEEGVSAVVGNRTTPSCNIAIAAVADELKVPVIATAASNDLVTVDADGNLHPYSFRLCFIDSYMGYLAGSYAYNKELGTEDLCIDHRCDRRLPSTSVGQYMVENTFTEAWRRRAGCFRKKLRTEITISAHS
ncbi:MAG: hypothetical protein ACLTSZ_08270 [Lachnospiraceae bacterium]